MWCAAYWWWWKEGNAARRERSGTNDHVSEGRPQEENKDKPKNDKRTESRMPRVTETNPRSLPLGQASGTQSLSADSCL